MNEKPITLTANEVRAVIEGRKTQKRVVLDVKRFKPMMTHESIRAPRKTEDGKWQFQAGSWNVYSRAIACPFGKPGDKLWIRESFGIFGIGTSSRVFVGYRERLPEGKTLAETDGGVDIVGVTSPELKWAQARLDCERWRPSSQMPRWASRLTLELVDVRVERLSEISETDAADEGMGIFLANNPQWDGDPDCYRKLFRLGWDAANPKHPWASNVWCWVPEWKRL